MVFVNRTVDEVTSCTLAVVFLICFAVLIGYLFKLIFVRHKSIKKVSNRVLDLKIGIKDKRLVRTAIYFANFLFLRMLLAIVLALTLLIPSIVQAVLFLILVLLSFALSFMRVFESVF